MHALEITEERTFTAKLNGLTVTGLAVESAWQGLTKYVRGDGEHLIVIDTEARVVTGSASILELLALGPKRGIELSPGEVYVGIADGHHVILLPGDVQLPWIESMEWAKSIGGDLPTRSEQNLLFEKSKDQFKRDWYWSNTQHAGHSDCAWGQDFIIGIQNYDYKSSLGRARAVRRLPI